MEKCFNNHASPSVYDTVLTVLLLAKHVHVRVENRTLVINGCN